jgi:hypothetical protein
VIKKTISFSGLIQGSQAPSRGGLEFEECGASVVGSEWPCRAACLARRFGDQIMEKHMLCALG